MARAFCQLRRASSGLTESGAEQRRGTSMTILLCGFTAFIVAFLVALGAYVYVVHRGIDKNGPF
jgi:hypothetical protein